MSTLLTPTEATEYLWEHYRIRRGNRAMQQMRLDGDGPAYHRDGNVVVYPRDGLDAWAVAKLGKTVKSTQEEAARHQMAEARRAAG
jgi:hypothetical protein